MNANDRAEADEDQAGERDAAVVERARATAAIVPAATSDQPDDEAGQRRRRQARARCGAARSSKPDSRVGADDDDRHERPADGVAVERAGRGR